ncbi:MAG: glycosyl hydrolase [Burkholderiales bacterium]|nr:glycosyl hydrolase [Burkholderiales bacterium]
MPELPRGRAICYSGYRRGQSPGARAYPSLAEIREDLLLLQPHWPLLRLYDCSPHAERVLEVIRREGLGLRVMLGAYLGAEVNNPGCPWGGSYSPAELAASVAENEAEVGRLIALARAYPETVFAVAVGNECTVDWTDHRVPVPRMIEHVRRVRQAVRQPVTFCENYVPWPGPLQPLVAELDFVSLHTYPVWEYQPVHAALAYTRENHARVVQACPGKPVVITEAGWATCANGRGIEPHNASPALQAIYVDALLRWTDEAGILCFVFEAFDEPWKGSPDPHEPEKHWGLYTEDRQPKQLLRQGLPAPGP